MYWIKKMKKRTCSQVYQKHLILAWVYIETFQPFPIWCSKEIITCITSGEVAPTIITESTLDNMIQSNIFPLFWYLLSFFSIMFWFFFCDYCLSHNNSHGCSSLGHSNFLGWNFVAYVTRMPTSVYWGKARLRHVPWAVLPQTCIIPGCLLVISLPNHSLVKSVAPSKCDWYLLL